MRLARLSNLCSSNLFPLIYIFYGKISTLSGGGFGKAFWYFGSWDGPLGLGRIVVLLGSRSFAWELGKVGYDRICTAQSRCRSGGGILFQHNNVVKQSTVKA